jgi:hypothetical protein
MLAGEEFPPVRAVDRGGLYEVLGIDDSYRAAASLAAGYDSVPADITASSFGPRRWRVQC